MHRSALWFLIVCAFVNAVPAVQQLCPQHPGPFNDELMGSGRETDDELAGARPQRVATRPQRRITPPDNLARIIRSAGRELAEREPELGQLLALRDPLIRRDDTIGTMAWNGDAIVFNRAYVASLSRDQLYLHLWQLGAALATPL